MKTLMLMTGAALLAMGGAAMAQTTMAPQDATGRTQPDMERKGTDGAKQPMMSTEARGAMAAETAQATPADPAAPMPAADAAMSADAAMTAQPAMPAADPAKMQSAQATVDAGWSKYDRKGSGQLTALEFGTWIKAAQGQDMAAQVDRTKTARTAGLPATKVLNETAADFVKADKNRDGMVSREELTTYLASA